MPPFYIQLVVLLMGAAMLFCMLAYALGCRAVPAPPLYAESRFPTEWDRAFTLLFLLIFVGGILLNLPKSEAEATANTETLPAFALLVSVLMQAALYLPMVVRYALLPRRQCLPLGFWRSVGLGTLAVIGLFSLGAVMSLLHLDELIMDFTGCPEQQDVVQSMQEGNSAQQLILAFAAVVMAPIGEEVCFRGFLYNILRSRAGVWTAALTSGFLFGVVHTSLVQLLPLTVFGIVQCLLYEKSKSLVLPMVVHATFNGLGVLTILLLTHLAPALQQGL